MKMNTKINQTEIDHRWSVKTNKNKEEQEMRTLALSIVALAVIICCTGIDAYAVVDKSVNITASGTIAGVTSLSVSNTTVTYGTTTADSFPTIPSTKAVNITYSSNYNGWTMRLYTNNSQVPVNGTMYGSTNIGRYAKGGLATAAIAPSGRVDIVPCKWIAKAGTNATVPPVPNWNPTNTTSKYSYVKDVRDEDDPTTVPNGTMSNNESWGAALADGYPNIAFGGPGGGWCVDPTNTNESTKYKGDVINSTTGIKLYIAAGWGSSFDEKGPVPCGAGSYSTKFLIDLVHE